MLFIQVRVIHRSQVMMTMTEMWIGTTLTATIKPVSEQFGTVMHTGHDKATKLTLLYQEIPRTVDADVSSILV